MDGAMGEKHAVVMVGFTTAALVAAFGVNLLLRQRNRKRLESVGENMSPKYCESEESPIVASDSYEDHEEEKYSVISEPRSEALPIGTAEGSFNPSEENLDELRDEEEAKEKKELKRLSFCMKELEGRVMMLSLQEAEIVELKNRVQEDEEKIEKLNLQEAEIIELKNRVKEDEEKIEKLNLQETEIVELKKRVREDEEKIEKLKLQKAEITELKNKIKNDENLIQQLQQEVAMLKGKNTPKKNWWKKNSTVHDVVTPVSSKKNVWK